MARLEATATPPWSGHWPCMAGVNTIYTNDLDALINIQASYIHVWETTDPYDGSYCK